MLNKEDYKAFTSKMDKSVSVLKDQLSTIRAGRANPSVLGKLTVDYYGVPTPVSQVGNITVPEARMLVFSPWDSSILKAVEKEIQKSDIGINPQCDGKVIKLIFPPLTEERRKELAKSVKKYGEDSKVAVRSIRRDANDYFKNLKKKSEITEDEEKVTAKDLQDATDKRIAEIDKIIAEKEKELMEI